MTTSLAFFISTRPASRPPLLTPATPFRDTVVRVRRKNLFGSKCLSAILTMDTARPSDSTAARDVNLKKLKIRDDLLRHLDQSILRNGFFGKATVEVEVANGVIVEVTKTLAERHR